MAFVARLTSLLCLLAAAAACGPTAGADGTGGGGGDGGPGGPGGCQGASCQNFCPGGTMTTLRGTVKMPNGIDPVPQALVYVPKEVTEFPGQVACEACGDITDSAIVSTQTNDDGSFVLGPVPTAANAQPGFKVQVVAQKGRFRKLVDVTIDTPCGDNATADGTMDLPSRTDGFNNIPNIAVATGDYDQMECVLLKLGIDQDAFDLYNGQGSLFPPGGTVGDLGSLLQDSALMKTYNIIFINCKANEYENLLSNAAVKNNILDYVKSGGRLYVTDWSYDYIEQVQEWSPIMDFAPSVDTNPSQPETMNAGAIGSGGIETDATVLDDGMRNWLQAVQQVTGDSVIDGQGRVHISHFLTDWVMQVAVAAMDNVTVWLEGPVSGGSYNNAVLPLTTTFDYNQCGRVLYSSYHTTGDGAVGNFPDYCTSGALSPQERVLEYMILHVADCITVN